MSPSTETCPQLLSLAVHELRTPASVVGGYLRMLLRDAEPLSERHRKMIQEAERSCTRLVEIVAEMSEVGKLDAALVTLNRKPIDLAALLSDVAGHVHEAKDRDVQLVVRDDGSAARMNGDDPRLRSAFGAVFRAILREKAGPATVVADRRRERIDGQDCAVVVVADTASVQEMYERGRGVFDDKRGGLGLALPLARRIFEGHGGGIWSPASNAAAGDAPDALARTSAIIVLPLTE
jgi:signal transduction histidine kinase